LQINTAGGKYNSDFVEFLINGDLANTTAIYRDKGVLVEWVYADLIGHLPFRDESIAWSTYHAYKDLGFVMKLQLLIEVCQMTC
jgi:hypothetical protein